LEKEYHPRKPSAKEDDYWKKEITLQPLASRSCS
jgi:hypothetical protein